MDHVDFTPQKELGMSNSNDEDDGDSGGHSGHGDKGHHSSNSDTSVVVGGVIGSLALIGLVIAALLTLKYYRRRQKRNILAVPDIPIYCETTFSVLNSVLVNRLQRFPALGASAEL